MPSKFVQGGPIPADGLYVRRAADEALAQAIRDGTFLCHVIAPSQQGKTSLAANIAAPAA